MLETLHNLKVNKVKRLGTQNQGGEAVERMKKFLVGINKKRHGQNYVCHFFLPCSLTKIHIVLAHEPLRVTLDDLHSAETKGKWWLVGAAWGGDPLVDRQQGNGQAAAPNPTQNGDNTTSNALLKLAKEHGMNTDIRRSIFVVLMSSDVSCHVWLKARNIDVHCRSSSGLRRRLRTSISAQPDRSSATGDSPRRVALLWERQSIFEYPQFIVGC